MPTLVFDILASGKFARLVVDEGKGILPNATLYLYVGIDNQFTTMEPILNDKDAANEYLLETKIAQLIDGITYFTKLQRFRLSSPTIIEDEDLGLVMQIPCEHIAYQVLKENKTTLNEVLVDPPTRIDHIIAYHNANPGSSGILFGNVINNLPAKDSLKFNYEPTSPMTIEDAFDEVIDRIKEAGPLGGVFKNFHYSIEANAANTRFFDITFDELGAQAAVVTINDSTNIQASLIDRTATTSDKKRKTLVIVKYNQRKGSLPMEFTRFASTFLHARFRPEWASGINYEVGDTIKLTYLTELPNILRYFKCVTAHFSSALTKPPLELYWREDFTIIPPWSPDAFYEVDEVVTRNEAGTIKHYRCITTTGPDAAFPATKFTNILDNILASAYTVFFSYTPFTSNLQAWKQNLANPTSPPAGFVGYAIDWNYRRQINDLVDYTNRFDMVSGKDVTRESNDPPTGRELFDGQRILVGTVPTGAFVTHAKQIAEYVAPLFESPGWRFSLPSFTNDTIYDKSTGKFRKYNGSAWVDAWDPVTNSDKPGPSHIVKTMKLVRGATGIPGQALECRFNWKDSLVTGGDDRHRSSRGAWLNCFYPYPRLDGSGVNIGELFGGDGSTAPNYAKLSHHNLNLTQTGKIGWNRGKISETHGRLPSHTFKIRLGFFKGQGDSEAELFYAKSNMAMVYWRVDENSRIFFKDYVIVENSEWSAPITIELPPFGPTNLYFNRLNELVEIFGYTLPYDFFIKEKEFAGVQYEWRANQAWGTFLKETYNETGMYIGNYQNVIDKLGEMISQLIPTTLRGINYIATGNWQGLKDLIGIGQATPSLQIDHTNIAIDELYYVKEGYAIFPETEQAEPRVDLIRMEQETDYLTSKAKAESTYIENQFVPNERYIGCTGNARIRYGHQIIESGSTVPGGSVTSVVSRQKDIVDNKGFNHELFLERKFVI